MDAVAEAQQRLAEVYEAYAQDADARELIGLYMDALRAHLRLREASQRMRDEVTAVHLLRQAQCLVRQAELHVVIVIAARGLGH